MSIEQKERDAWQFGRRHPSAPVAYIDNGLGEELAVVYQCETPEKLRAVRLMSMAPYMLAELKRLQEAFGWPDNAASKLIAQAEGK